MRLTIGILTWGSPVTLENSLSIWDNKGLFDQADEILIFEQETNNSERILEDLALTEIIRIIKSPKNIGIAKGYKRLVEEATGDLFLFLENDWTLPATVNMRETDRRIVQAMTLLDIEVVDAVRLRHRRQHGYPLWTLQFKDQELLRPTHLLDCVHWRENPDLDFPNYIHKIGDMYAAFATHANWTNNPTMFRTTFLRENILPRIGDGDAEQHLQSWWETTSAIVAQGEGLFTHYRID